MLLTVSTIVGALSSAVVPVVVAIDGAEPNGPSWWPSMSADGSLVAYASTADNLVIDDTNGVEDVFVYDRDSGETRRVSVASDGTQGDAWSSMPTLAADGGSVSFVSAAANLVAGDTNESLDRFRHDLSTGETVLVEPFDWESARSSSADGSVVAFASDDTDLVANDTNQTTDVFVTYVAAGRTERISVSSDGEQGNGWSSQPSISADGSTVVFLSVATNLAPTDVTADADLFVHDLTTGTTSLVSLPSYGGYEPPDLGAAVLSGDGQIMAFPVRLWWRQYGQDLMAQSLVTGEVHFLFGGLSDPVMDEPLYSPSLSYDGDLVAFTHLSAGVAADTKWMVSVGAMTWAPPLVDRFIDDDTSEFEDDIDWLATRGITKGCTDDRFCPDQPVTRGEMAAFLARMLFLDGSGAEDRFTDDDASIFESDINAIAGLDITTGCSPDWFCPDDYVTRGQMAAFLVRTFTWQAAEPEARFVDDDASIFEGDIERLAAVGVTMGCNPPINDRFCPDALVTREQMAAFLHRAMG